MKKHGIEKRPLKCILLSYHGINNEVSEMFFTYTIRFKSDYNSEKILRLRRVSLIKRIMHNK